MQFINPAFLYALGFLAIPIILHLFHFRRFKKVYFTNTKFLKEIKEETSARSKLRNLLVLAMRLLALAFLVFAFAQPFIPAKNQLAKKGIPVVSVFVDNSFSMNALSDDVKLLAKEKQMAHDIIASYPTEVRFQVLTNDFEGRHQRLYDKEDALGLVEEVASTPNVKKLSKVFKRQVQALSLDKSENKVAYIISDFQKNINDLTTDIDTSIALNLIPLQAVQERNIAIDSAWFEAPVQMISNHNKLLVRARNYSNEDAENVRLALNYQGETRPIGTMSIKAQSYQVDTVAITPLKVGWHEATLNITDYPIQFDDRYFLSFHVAEKVSVLAINDAQINRYISAALPDVTNIQVNALKYGDFPKYDMIVLNDLKTISSGLAFELKKYVNGGGNLLVFPGKDADINSYNAFLDLFPVDQLKPFEKKKRKMSRINVDEFVFNGVFENVNSQLTLPTTQGNYPLTQFSARKATPLLRYRDGSSALVKYGLGAGNVYLSSAPVSEDISDLVRSGEVFIPMLYKMAISAGKASPISYTIGRDSRLEAPHLSTNQETVYRLKGTQDEFIPQQRVVGGKVIINISDEVKSAGFYLLEDKEGNAISHFAFNYDRIESDLNCTNIDELKRLQDGHIAVLEANDSDQLTAQIEERGQGRQLWKWCVILVLGFLLAESLLLRFWK